MKHNKNYIFNIKKELWIRILIITILISLIIIFYPKYEILTNITVMMLSILSEFFIGTTPIFYQNNLILNLGSITPIVVSPECSGLFILIIFLLVVWLIPNISIKSRFFSFLLIPILFFSNIIRLLFAVIIGDKFGVESLIFYHATIGQIFIFIIMIYCFILIIKYNDTQSIYRITTLP